MRLRTFARYARDSARKSLRGLRLRRDLATLARTLDEGGDPQPALMHQLVRGWGNEAWSASAAFLLAMLRWVPQTSGAILECGSGISTLVLATAAVTRDRKLHSLEHDAAWAAMVDSKLPRNLRTRVSLLVAPLKSYGSFDWYSVEQGLPAAIGFVVCDGPPAATRGGRYGLGPVIGQRLAPGSVILLDDTQRPQEHAIVARWCSEIGASVIEQGRTFTAIQVPDRTRT